MDFFESFKNYDEAGSLQRIQVLKYLVLANMLMDSEINPFDSQETKPYKTHAEIVAMTDLVGAYQRGDILEFEKILKENEASIMGDTFIREYIDSVVRNIRTTSLVQKIRPYTRVTLASLAEHLNVSEEQVEDLLIGLILDGRIGGRIDQVNRWLELEAAKPFDVQRQTAIEKWSSSVEGLRRSVMGPV